MVNILNEFEEKFKVNDLLIFETNHWKWSLRPEQITLGSGILSLKRECEKLSDLKVEEFEDLNNIIKSIEETLSSTFNYDIMNYLMLMMVDKHVHYHVIPRYSNSVIFEEKKWEDISWPKPPDLSTQVDSKDDLNKILNYIKSHINRD